MTLPPGTRLGVYETTDQIGDGKRLYYWNDGSILQATLNRDSGLRVLTREVVVKGPFANDYDVSRDGSRFVVIEPDDASATLVVIPNWVTELRRMTIGTH